MVVCLVWLSVLLCRCVVLVMLVWVSGLCIWVVMMRLGIWWICLILCWYGCSVFLNCSVILWLMLFMRFVCCCCVCVLRLSCCCGGCVWCRSRWLFCNFVWKKWLVLLVWWKSCCNWCVWMLGRKVVNLSVLCWMW